MPAIYLQAPYWLTMLTAPSVSRSGKQVRPWKQERHRVEEQSYPFRTITHHSTPQGKTFWSMPSFGRQAMLHAIPISTVYLTGWIPIVTTTAVVMLMKLI